MKKLERNIKDLQKEVKQLLKFFKKLEFVEDSRTKQLTEMELNNTKMDLVIKNIEYKYYLSMVEKMNDRDAYRGYG